MYQILSVGQLQIVQSALAHFPQMAFFQGQGHLHCAALGLGLGASHGFPLIGCAGPERAAAGNRSGDMQDTFFDIRYIFHTLNMGLGYKFQPNGLPNAGSAGIEAAVRFIAVALLAGGDQQIPAVIRGMNHQGVLTGGQILRNVHGKGHEAASMTAAAVAIDIDRGFIIHRTEMQQHPTLQLGFRNGDAAAIPHRTHEIGVANAGQLTLRAEGHLDLHGESLLRFIEFSCLTAVTVVYFKLPQTIKVRPVITHELGIGMFLSIDHKACKPF